MSAVRLPCGRVTSALGFGCSALVGGRTARESLRLLDVAFDAGIRHFDVARVYGSGDAEHLVGRFAAPRRGELTLATKFGIDPLVTGRTLGAAKRVVRVATRRSPHLLALLRARPRLVAARGAFSPQNARSSLAVSLAALRLEHVELYLLHDCAAADWAQPALLAALDELVAAGRIGCYGAATDRQRATAILALPGSAPPVMQADADVFEAPVRAPDGAPSVRISYGCLRRALPAITARVRADAATAALWSRELDIDVCSDEALGTLLLAEALDANDGGIVLFSSGEPRRIERYGAVAATRPHAREQLDALRRLAAGLRTG